MNKLSHVLLTAFALFILLTRAAHAYVDPGTGSMLVQLLIGGTAGLLVILKLYWNAILSFLHIRQSPHKANKPESGPEGEEPTT